MENAGSKTSKIILASVVGVGQGVDAIHLFKDCDRQQAGCFVEFDLERESPEAPPVRTLKLTVSSTGTAAHSVGAPILWPRTFTRMSS